MKKRELIKFLKEHPQKEMSVAALADFQFRILLKDDFNKEVEKFSDRMLPAERLKEIAETAKSIEAVQTPEELLQIMLKSMTFSNLTTMAKKALAMQDEAMPPIVNRYKDSKHAFSLRMLQNPCPCRQAIALIGCRALLIQLVFDLTPFSEGLRRTESQLSYGCRKRLNLGKKRPASVNLQGHKKAAPTGFEPVFQP